MRRLLAGLCASMVIATSYAASFNCEKSESKVETLICGSQSLSAQDEKLGAVYAAAQRAASAEQRQKLVASQRLWVKNVRNSCGDEGCLAKAYEARIDQLASPSPQNADDAPFRKTDILANHPAPLGKGFPLVLPSIDGDLVYSHYDDNGNTKSIVQFDFTTGQWTNLVFGKNDPALMAQDARYIVFHTPHSASFPVEVMDRKTGAVVARKRLAKPVQNAFINGDRLVLFQGRTEAYGFQQAVAILELPSLRLIQETTLPGFHLVGIRGKHTYTAYSANGKSDLMVFTPQFEELGRVQIPPPMEKLNVSCEPTIEQNEVDRALLIANCGEMHILDLKSFSVVHSIRRYSLFYSVALHEGLIFTTSVDKLEGDHNGIVVFDMSTGKEVAHLPITASTIAIKKNILLAAGAPSTIGMDIKWPMETYRINSNAIRNGGWQQIKVVQQCRQAEAQLAETRDLYGAIELCQQAGIDAHAQATSIPAAVLPVLRQYGLWLSQTLDKCSEAVRVLERVQAEKPDSEVEHALKEARIKAKVVGNEATVELTDAERQTDFGRVLENGGPQVKTTTKSIEFGAFSNLFHFSGDKLYVGRYGCRISCDGGASIGVFDRNTLDELASIPIAPHNDDYQDSIVSIATDDRHIYASVEYRYEQKGRPNFFAIDRKTLQVTKRAQIDTTGTLRLERGKLMVCSCHFTDNQTCAALDPATLKLSEIPDKMCVQSGTDNDAIVNVDKKMIRDANFVAATQDYLVARFQRGSSAEYGMYPRTGGQIMPLVRGQGDKLDWPASVDSNDIVIGQNTLGGQQIKLISLPSGRAQTLFGLPVTPLFVPVPMLHEQSLYVGYGRNLLIYDIQNHRIRRYIRGFIPGEFRNNCCGLDANRINRLIIDQGKLIALTLDGTNSQIVRLSDL